MMGLFYWYVIGMGILGNNEIMKKAKESELLCQLHHVMRF